MPGWLDKRIVPLFRDYAATCFRLFGDRVRYWTTFNEAWTFIVLGYGSGSKAPGEPYTNIATYPYLAGHNVLLAHSAAVAVFRQDSVLKARGALIGITNNCDWNEPATNSVEDIAAAERANEWWLAWFSDPIWLGDYPASMRAKLGERLPTFTPAESESLKGSADFFGLNHYGSMFTQGSPAPADYGLPGGTEPSYWADYEAHSFHTDDMPKAASVWLFGVPWGLRKLLNWVAKRYNSPAIYVTENGWSTPGDVDVETGVHDPSRVLFYANYTSEMQRAINEDGVDVRGYFAWSLMDNFEWERGYSERFGLVHTDFVTQKRYPKTSALWYSATIQANAIVDPGLFVTENGDTSREPCAQVLPAVKNYSTEVSVAIGAAAAIFGVAAVAVVLCRLLGKSDQVVKGPKGATRGQDQVEMLRGNRVAKSSTSKSMSADSDSEAE